MNPPAPSPLPRHRNLALLALVGLMAMQISSNWKADLDSGAYLSIARSLALHGKLMHHGMPHLYFAPGYPVLISPAFFLGSFPFVAIGVIHLLFAVILTLATYRWFAQYDGRGALFITAMVMVNVGFWDVYRQTRAETAFMATMMVSAFLLASATTATSRSKLILATATASVSVIVMCSIRQVGLLLPAGFAVAVLIRAMQHRISWMHATVSSMAVGFCGVAIVCALVGHDAKFAGPDEPTYVDHFRDNQHIAQQVAEGFRRQTAQIGRLVIPGMWKSYSRPGQWLTFNTALYLLFCLPIAIGWWKFARETLDPLALTFPLYFALFVYWPFDQGTRFTVPMLPVLAGSIWYLLWPFEKKREMIFMALIALHLLVSIGAWIRDARIVRQWNRQWPAMTVVAAILPAGSDPIDARGVDNEKWLFLQYLTDRRFVWTSPNEPIPQSMKWVVSPQLSPPSPGFHTVADVEGIRIEQRDERASAPPTTM